MIGTSFDDLVGAGEDRWRYRQTERLCGVEVDDQLDPRGLNDRQLCGLLNRENAARVDAGLTERVSNITPVAHQSACRGKLVILIDGRESPTEKQPGESLALSVEEGIGADHKPASTLLGYVSQHSIEVALRTGMEDMKD